MKHFVSLLAAGFLSIGAFAANPDELLPPEQAFKPSLQKTGEKTATVKFEIADRYYMYRERFKFSLVGQGALKADFPAGKKKHDEYFGEVETYRHAVELPLSSDTAFPPGAQVEIVSQGCADAGVCYPPQTVQLALADAPAGAAPDKLTQLLGSTASPVPATAAPAGGTGDGSALFASGNLAGLLAFFFLAGLGLAFTACMYPLIPIVSGIVVGQGGATGKLRGFVLSMVYVQGMALSYAIAGVAAALSGTLLSAAMQNPWVLGVFASFFVLMSLSMFGLFELQLPGALQSRLNDVSNKLPGGRWLPVFGMGALSALIVGPCVAPPLAAALGYIGASGDVLRGGLALYAMALGIGLPLIVVGVAGGHVLPKAGPWMTLVKNVFGTVMLAVALWIAHPVLPDWLFMLACAVLAIGAGVSLSALDSLPPQAPPGKRLAKAAGVLLLLLGVAQLIGLLAGARDPLQPLRTFGGSGRAAATAPALPFQPVASSAQLDSAIAAAAGKTVMLDFYADWCVSCHEMERFTFSDPAVQQKLAGMVLLKADVTAGTDEHKALLKRFGLFGPPGTIFFGPAGTEIGQRLIGFEDAAAFQRRLAGL
ncbi:protein-disulfide reductase DsbD [Chitinimonas arctica]|uniref:Thiol:disulfide interchange protein DsbD n=1 Tax=Chitinimonas arctica TaxID=2594795 RepID=A0A516SCX8_9NEIS|nr:protein-disulfide reductase DsbD [Chitinimonas arctica]QDQ25898.1 protein-disulfide reductase DsbD [Chitinimonas arctica]